MSLDPTRAVPAVLADSASRLPLVAIEAVRTLPVERVVFGHAKVIGVLEGRSTVETPSGRFELRPGDVFVLGAGVWCSAVPAPFVRTWTVYADETYLRSQTGWSLPPADRMRLGVHPSVWDGSALHLPVGIDVVRALEPYVRQMSVLSSAEDDVTGSRLVALFAQAVEVIVPALLEPAGSDGAPPPADRDDDRGRGVRAVWGRLRRPAPRPEVRRAAELLRARMAEVWTVERLAGAVALSPTHLGRLFAAEFGVPPMRFLIEVRTTEFARLIEETELPIGIAARRVGWTDPRVASAWFRRRFGISPSRFRQRMHPFCVVGEEPCGLCRGACVRNGLAEERLIASGRSETSPRSPG